MCQDGFVIFDDDLQATKKLLREDFVKEWAGYWEDEAAWGWKLLTQDSTVKTLGGVIQRLSGKKSKL